MKYYIFGAGSNAYGVIKFFGKENIISIIDNDSEKIGKQVDSLNIISTTEFQQLYKGESVLISTLHYRDEISSQLQSIGIENIYKCPDMLRSYYEPQRVIEWLKSTNKSFIFIDQNPWTDRYYKLIKEHSIENLVNGILIKAGEKNYSDIKSLNPDNIDVNDLLIQTSDFKCYTFDNEIINLYTYNESYSFNRTNSYKHLFKYKDIHKEQTCFIVGNGPSLNAEDLELIEKKSIFSFGCNRIYKIYDQTSWKPDYYFIVDLKLMNSISLECPKNLAKKSLFIRTHYNKVTDKKWENTNEYLAFQQEENSKVYSFSDNWPKGIYHGLTVIYEMIQAAVYMGFTEIILLGVDFSFVDRKKGQQHFYKNDDIEMYDPLMIKKMYRDKTLKAFEAAKYYAETNGIKILNATRGGELEVFERVEFENKFKQMTVRNEN